MPKTSKRATRAVKRPVKKATSRLRSARSSKSAPVAAPVRRRPVRPDVPLDALGEAYSPTQTSLKTPFRNDGADRERDQEFSRGIAAERWKDEDRFTNKSGDPRIGTHHRKYEQGE